MFVYHNSFSYIYTKFLLKQLKVLHRHYLQNPHNILFKQVETRRDYIASFLKNSLLSGGSKALPLGSFLLTGGWLALGQGHTLRY